MNNRSIFFVTILLQKFTQLHFNKLDHFRIVNKVTFIQENNQARNVYLASQKNVLTRLWHRTISCCNYQDSTIHLGSTSNHVLDIVGVSRAVNMSVVTLCCFVLDMGSINGNTTLFLFRSIINLIERLNLLACTQLFVEHFGDRGRQSSLTVVDMTDCTNVYMRFGTLKFFLSHSFTILYN